MKKLFGTDGIRAKAGIYPLDLKTIKYIGFASAGILKKNVSAKPVIIIGRDTRESGQDIVLNLKKGINGAGVEVMDLGVIPTPGISYMVKKTSVLAGIVVSASHNPYDDNGIKFFGPDGRKLADHEESEIEAMIHELTDTEEELSKEQEECFSSLGIEDSLVHDYALFLKNSFPKKYNLEGLKIIIDSANGSTYKVAEDVFSVLGAQIIALNVSPDGRNINKNCGALYPHNLSDAVLKNNAHCAIAFDGDGDRVIFVDEKGCVRDGDYILSSSALFLKEKGKLNNNMLVTTVMANLGLFKAMKKHNIDVLRTNVGDRYVFEGMMQTGAVIGGEQSGHIIFKDFLPTGDGILSALQVLYMLKDTGRNLSDLSSVMTKYPQILINTKVQNKIPLASLKDTLFVIKGFEEKLKEDGRILVRYSGTENLLRVMIEGQNKDEINAMAQTISATAEKEIEKAV